MTAISATARTLQTLSDGTVRLKVDIEPQDRAAAMELFGEPGAPIALARLTQEAAQKSLQSSWQKELRLSSFFFKPETWEACGTDSDFLQWIRTQPCKVCKNKPVEAAHVRRVANGAGMGIKPPYSAVPLCPEHHRLQHQKGESAIGGRELMDKWRIECLAQWCWEYIKEELGYDSWRDMPIIEFQQWAKYKGLSIPQIGSNP